MTRQIPSPGGGRDEQIRKLYAAGLTQATIAERFKIDQKQVSKICTKDAKAFSWTPENEAILKAMLDKGQSAGEISKRLGVTRNMVIGKATRLGGRRVSNGSTRPPKWAPATPQFTVERRPLRTIDLVCEPITLTELRPSSCRYPIDGDWPEMRFCGARKDGERSFCPGHSGIAYQSAKPSRSELARSLRRYVA